MKLKVRVAMYVQLNFGRNVEGMPMSSERWDDFRNDIITVLVMSCNGSSVETLNAIEVHNGSGTWSGVREDSAHVSIFWEPGVNVDILRERVARVKRNYRQDSIALIVGSELV